MRRGRRGTEVFVFFGTFANYFSGARFARRAERQLAPISDQTSAFLRDICASSASKMPPLLQTSEFRLK
jgi:hypothetical protein